MTGFSHCFLLPFGELFISQRNIEAESDFDSRYKFTAKELDNETNYTYFGARYYDSDVSVWLSVDPMAGKYPALSPYAYCANNPVMLIDLDGRDIYIIVQQNGNNNSKTEKGNHEQIISWLTSSKNGNAMVQKYLHNPNTDIYITMSFLDDNEGNYVAGLNLRYWDKNDNLTNPNTIDIGNLSHVNDSESPFHLTLIDKEKENYFISLNQELYGIEKLFVGNKEASKVLGHEIGAHAKNKLTSGIKEHDDWGQENLSDPATTGSSADILNKQIDRSKTRNNTYKLEDQGRGKYKLIEN